MIGRKAQIALAFLLTTAAGSAAPAASSLPKSGSIAGYVRDNAGIPQMGATVMLLNRYERVVQQALTNEKGIFGFSPLPAGIYSIRVNLASFMPALKHSIRVQPGMQSLLYVDLATILSSIELVYATPGKDALMSDDWKWTLKTAVAARPVLRLLPDLDPVRPQHHSSSVFADTRGMIALCAGDAGTDGNSAFTPDLGTAFALATSFFGNNQLQLSGNVGYSGRSGAPVAGFRTRFRRNGETPDITVTMRQVYLPSQTAAGVPVGGQQDGLPALRTLSVAMNDKMEIVQGLLLEYGVSLDSISFLDHLNYVSPYARLTYDAGSAGSVQLAYSSGMSHPDLDRTSNMSREVDAELSQDLAALATMPRVSLRGGHAEIQRASQMELGYQKRVGSTTFRANGYSELVSNAALMMSSAGGLVSTGDVLPDFASESNVVNAGGYHRYGYAVSVARNFGDRLEIGTSYGSAGALTMNSSKEALSVDDLRSQLRTAQREWAAARISTTLPVMGTQIASSYEWIDTNALVPAHVYLTQTGDPGPGFNIRVRQPIPVFGGARGHLEATAELQNLLAQGYLSVMTANEKRALLTESPRAVRGGLSFIF